MLALHRFKSFVDNEKKAISEPEIVADNNSKSNSMNPPPSAVKAKELEIKSKKSKTPGQGSSIESPKTTKVSY